MTMVNPAVSLNATAQLLKVKNFRPVPIFVLSTWNWFVQTNFRTFMVLKNKSLWNSVSQSKKIFSYSIKFSTFSKVRKYENKYRAKICDFTVKKRSQNSNCSQITGDMSHIF